MTAPRPDDALSVLQKMFNEVLVQTGKVLRTASRDSKGNLVPVDLTTNSKIPSSVDAFHDALDDLESEIIRAKSALLRDLNQLRAKRVEVPAPAAEPKPVRMAPPAPMVEDQDLTMLDPVSTGPTAPPTGTGPPMGTENKPVAPFPDMDLDLTVSPEVSPAPAPTQAPAPTAPAAVPAATTADASQIKPSPKQAAAQVAMAGRPASAPPKPEPRAAHPQPSHSAAAASPQSPASAAVTTTLTAPSSLTTTATPAAASAPAVPDSEMVFTDMAFSLAPATNETQGQAQAPQPEVDLETFGETEMPDNLLNLDSFDASAGGSLQIATDSIGGTGDAGGDIHADPNSIDAEIDTLLNSTGSAGTDRMDMDYELGGIGLDNNSFEDLFFASADDNPPESNDAYFGL